MKIYDIFVHLEEQSDPEIWERALRENSNLALDWLWLATLVGGEKRSYSIKRAMEIDPLAADYLPRSAVASFAGQERTAEPCTT